MMKSSDEPDVFVAFNDCPNSFVVDVPHKQFFFAESFKPSSLVCGQFIEVIFYWLIKRFKIVIGFHAEILRDWFAKVPGDISLGLGELFLGEPRNYSLLS